MSSININDSLIGIIGFSFSVLSCSINFQFQKYMNNKYVMIKEMYIYPIKSCKGIKVVEAKVTKTGFEFDRIFMIVDKNNKFISQRTYPAMALINISILEDKMKVSASGMEDLYVPTAYPNEDIIHMYNLLLVTVWGEECESIEVLNEVGNDWFNRYLKTSGLKLVRIKETFNRKTDCKYSSMNGKTSFSDGYPFLITSKQSLDYLNNKLEKPISILRFRPNIVIDGNVIPFYEDIWSIIRIHLSPSTCTTTPSQISLNSTTNYIEMSVCKPCSRCLIPDIDPANGVPDPNREISKILRSFRTGNHIGYKKQEWKKENLDHGMNGINNIIKVGMVVEILPTKNKYL